MQVHHLSCFTMCPPLGRVIINDVGRMVCHCLLVESSAGLVLVDTGIGKSEQEDLRATLGRRFAAMAGARGDPELAAVRQVVRLGLDPADVRHIIVTHLDLDHAGGIPDFPGAKVHVYQPELDAARARATLLERERYRPHQLAGADLVGHPADGEGDDWYGFRAVRPLPGLVDIALVPLLGHSRGHCGIAVRARQGWLLHCGDAYFHTGEVAAGRPRCSLGLRIFQRIIATDNTARQANQARLRALARTQGSEVQLFCAHDPREFDAFATQPPARLFA
jgi:glyoxylase-like metal-dependent hydrolase (beta-lactamase superfamily II)